MKKLLALISVLTLLLAPAIGFADSDTFYVTESDDDGCWNGSTKMSTQNGAWFGSLGDGWVLFDSVTIPQGATITTAYISFYCQTSTSGAQDTDVYAEDADNATPPTNKTDWDGRTWTTAYGDWDSIPNWSVGQWYDSASLVDVVKEVVDRGGWSSGNDMMFRMTGGANYRMFEQWDSANPNEAELYVEWSAGGGGWTLDVGDTAAANIGEIGDTPIANVGELGDTAP